MRGSTTIDKMVRKRLVAEGVLIVVSILLAFTIDAWWDDRGRRQDEREAFRALVQDFESAAGQLASVSLAHDSAFMAAERLLELTGPEANAIAVDSLARLIAPLIRIPTFSPPLGALDALLGSGELRLVENADLRAALASFPSSLARMNRTQSYGADLVLRDLLPLLSREVPLRTYGLGARGQTRFSHDARALLRSLEFENAVQRRMMNHEFALGAAESMKERIEIILDMLRAELGA